NGKLNGQATDCMSTDWNDYSTPEQTRQRGPNPGAYGVARLAVLPIRQDVVPNQEVLHEPTQDDPQLQDNRAHTHVKGSKKEQTQLQLIRIAGDLVLHPTLSKH